MTNTSQALIVGLCLASAASPSTAQTAAAVPTRAQILDAARDLMQAARYCTFVTVDEEGQPRARVVDPFPPETDMTVWMATKAATRKVAQIRKNPRATLLCFDGTKKGYVTLLGTAAVVDDPVEKAKRWKPEWKDFYDDENRGKDYVLIRLKPTRLEVLSPAHGLGNDPRTWLPPSLEIE
jgi:general stress protein 26